MDRLGGMIRCGGWVDRLRCMIRGWFGSMIWGRFSFISHIGNISEKKLIRNILICILLAAGIAKSVETAIDNNKRKRNEGGN